MLFRSGSDHEIRIYKSDNNVSDHIQFYNGTTRVGEIGCEDTSWLRLNQETNINIYTPRYIRADAGFFVDGQPWRWHKPRDRLQKVFDRLGQSGEVLRDLVHVNCTVAQQEPARAGWLMQMVKRQGPCNDVE